MCHTGTDLAIDTDVDTAKPKLGGHDFNSTRVTHTTGRDMCEQCTTGVRHGCYVKRCKHCELQWCADCVNKHGNTEAMPQCSTRCEMLAARRLGGDCDEETMLMDWNSQPAPRTLTYVPRNLRQRVATILQ